MLTDYIPEPEIGFGNVVRKHRFFVLHTIPIPKPVSWTSNFHETATPFRKNWMISETKLTYVGMIPNKVITRINHFKDNEKRTM